MMRVTALPDITELSSGANKDISGLVYRHCLPTVDNAMTIIDWMLEMTYPNGVDARAGYISSLYAAYQSEGPLSLSIHVTFIKFLIPPNKITHRVIELKFDTHTELIEFGTELVNRHYTHYAALNIAGST